jgi:uncharacterized protein (UPF0335 family)
MGRISRADRAAILAANNLVGPPVSGKLAPATTLPITDTREMSPTPPPAPVEEDNDVGGIAADRLRSIVERIERLEEEKKALSDDIKDIYAEGKSAGFDVKVLRQLIRVRKMEPAEFEEQQTLLDLYLRALGM